ncbi:hypothetical protein [Zhihengliuella halotolerans]|uniref:hypothetical protein n=1 Tax=Zhihengliuella halotolerans TaxID=370736 RepID=UPI000C80D8AA|nr:hypothetical protein [Zhihengliuella halotolerans]
MKPQIVLCVGEPAHRAKICRWLEANGVDPMRVPRSARIIVTGTRILFEEIQFYQRRSGGKRPRVKDSRLVTRRRAKRLRVAWAAVA